ncbi:MAG: response regulator [Candidatus Omnitrophica bacterium]|nr:response regulator [Candidatus Omnitrophota bacterium]
MAKKVLIIDDDLDVLGLMVERIKSWGYEAVGATSGKEGTEIIKNKNADIVVLDYFMPDMNGVDTLKKMRRIDSKLPVIMLTGYPDNKVIESAEKLGIVILSKASSYQDTEVALKAVIQAIDRKLDK